VALHSGLYQTDVYKCVLSCGAS